MAPTLGRHVLSNDPASTEQRNVPSLVGVVWGLLVVNTLGPGGDYAIIPIWGPRAQLITTVSLGVAFVLALLLNPRLRVRPSSFLLLLTLLLVVSTVSSTLLNFELGAIARCARLVLFIATLWLLTCWWGNSLTFVRYHIRALFVVLVSVIVGLVAAPNLAIPDHGLLTGVLWPLPATDVGQYAAVVAGLTLVLWLTRSANGWATLGVAGSALVLLLLSHTRTAIVGLIVGLAVAGLPLTLGNARARRAIVAGAVAIGLIALAFGPALSAWFRRGQDEDAFAGLSGRRAFWDALLAEPRTADEQLLGLGLNHKSFDGLPIDSSWLTVYNEQGFLGVAIVAAFLLGLVLSLTLRPQSAARACAGFLIAYCLVASYTEVGLGDASPYLLHLFVAAAVLSGDGLRRDAKAQCHYVREPGQRHDR